MPLYTTVYVHLYNVGDAVRSGKGNATSGCKALQTIGTDCFRWRDVCNLGGVGAGLVQPLSEPALIPGRFAVG